MGIIKKIITLVVILLLAGLIWGLVGGHQAKDIGTTCDSGIGDGEIICWDWHKNIIGHAQGIFNGDDNPIDDFLD